MDEQPRKAIRKNVVFPDVGVVQPPETVDNIRVLLGQRDGTYGTPKRFLRVPKKVIRRLATWTVSIALFVLVASVGAEVAYTLGRPIAMDVSLAVTRVGVRIPVHSATVAPTWTSTPTPTPMATPTPTAIALPKVPSWFTEKQLIRCAGIVAGETWSQDDVDAAVFLATQIFYDYVTYKGKLPIIRWKGYGTPTHIGLQACNVALMNYNEPLYSQCKFVGGINDSDYFRNTYNGLTLDYFCSEGGCRVVTDTASLPAVRAAVLGWSCK